jgi:predicted transcriptional regulator
VILLLAWSRTYEDHSARDLLLELVQRSPGIHKSELHRASGLGWGTVTHHLDVLLRHGRLKGVKRGKLLHLFPPDRRPEAELYLAALRDPMHQSILSRLGEPAAAGDGAGIQELSRALNLSRKVVRRHLTALGDLGLVERTAEYRPRFRRRDGEGTPPSSRIRPGA